MIPKKEVSFFKRYLKEKGLYNVFKQDLAISSQEARTPLHEFIKRGKQGYSTNIIMDCLLWSVSNYKYWAKTYNDYITYYYKNFKNK